MTPKVQTKIKDQKTTAKTRMEMATSKVEREGLKMTTLEETLSASTVIKPIFHTLLCTHI